MEVVPANSATVVTADSAPAASIIPVNVGDSGDPNVVTPPASPELNADGTPKVVAPVVTQGAEPSEAEKRIKQLVAQRKEEETLRLQKEREAEYWKGVAEGRRGIDPAAPAPALGPDAPPVPPEIAKFEKFEEFERAKDEYLIKRAKWEMKQDAAKEAAKAKVERVNNTWTEKMREAEGKYPDFKSVIANPSFIQTDAVAFLIKDSDIGPDVAYYLGSNLAEMTRINALPPHQAAKEIGKIEAKLLAPKPVDPPKNLISQAPEPIKPVVPAPLTEVDEDKLPIEEFVKRRNAKEFAARKGKAF
jgi:hypothetical protein